MAAVEQGHSAANAGSNLGKVETHSIPSTHSIVGLAGDVADIHSNGPGMIEDDLRYRVEWKFAGKCCSKSEARAGVGHIVLPATDVDFQGFGELDSTLPRRGKSDHAFAQGHNVVLNFTRLVRFPGLADWGRHAEVQVGPAMGSR
jgi:hypothetical protein